MKIMTKYISTILFLLYFGNVIAQKDVTGFLNYGLSNAKVLSEKYLMPQSKMVSSALIADFQSTARVKHLGGVDLKIGVNYAFVPTADYLFNVEDMISGGLLTGITLADGSVVKAPTVAKRFLQGQSRPQMNYNGEITEMPNGSDYSSMLSPIVGLSVGLSLNTEIGFSYMLPNGDDNSGNAKMYSINLKHSLKNYLPFIRRTPFLQMALAGSYSKYRSTTDVSYNEQTGQELTIDASGYGGGLLVGMDFPVFGFTGKVGYYMTQNTFTLDGTYTGIPVDGTVESPELFTNEEGFINFGVGMFFRIYHFRLSANYSYGLYSALNAGIAYEFGN